MRKDGPWHPVNRRDFLTGLGAAIGLIAMPEPVSRIWAVGADLSRKPYSPPKLESVSDYNPPGFDRAVAFTLTPGVAATYTVNGKTIEFPTIQGERETEMHPHVHIRSAMPNHQAPPEFKLRDALPLPSFRDRDLRPEVRREFREAREQRVRG